MNKNVYHVYMLMSQNNSALYVGVTNNLVRRVYEHKNESVDGFTKRYKCKKLVYFEAYNLPSEAIIREKQLKNWHRDWKLNIIREMNPDFMDLYVKILK